MKSETKSAVWLISAHFVVQVVDPFMPTILLQSDLFNCKLHN